LEPRRIAHVTATFPPYQGGTGNVCYHNARVLAARGHDVHVYTAAWPGERDDPAGVTVHRQRPLVRVGNAPLLPKLLGLRDVDLIHLHFPFYAGGELVAMTGVPYVVTYHQDVEIAGLSGRVTGLHDRVVGRRVLAGAARLCPTSLDYLRHSAIADLEPRFRTRVTPIPNGVDLDRFRPMPSDPEQRRRFGLPRDGLAVLFVGAMDAAHHFKGVPMLLHALARTPGVSALLVGEGDLRPSYERLAADLGIAGRTAFTGRLPSIDLPGAYHAADALILPSVTRGEAFGMVLIEAMASGRPVVATSLPGVRSVVADGQDGFLVPPADEGALAAALARLAAMPASDRAAMGALGRAKVEREYGWERIADRLEAIYADVLAEGARRGR
jgi:glycosyltransferase involved in cell wall biosynthesis